MSIKDAHAIAVADAKRALAKRLERLSVAVEDARNCNALDWPVPTRMLQVRLESVKEAVRIVEAVKKAEAAA